MREVAQLKPPELTHATMRTSVQNGCGAKWCTCRFTSDARRTPIDRVSRNSLQTLGLAIGTSVATVPTLTSLGKLECDSPRWGRTPWEDRLPRTGPECCPRTTQLRAREDNTAPLVQTSRARAPHLVVAHNATLGTITETVRVPTIRSKEEVLWWELH